jgi:hypothetical protein
MAKRSREEWQDIADNYPLSGLSNVNYCRQVGVSKIAFYTHCVKRQQKPQTQSSPFIKVKRTASPSPNITLTVGTATLALPLSCDPLWLAQVLRALP